MDRECHHSALDTAKRFFDHWAQSRIADALEMLADDVLYDNVPFPDIRGKAEVRQFHEAFGLGTRFRTRWEVLRMAYDGEVVLNERIDVFIHENGAEISLPVMGTIEVLDGRITVWRDYFDPADMERQLASCMTDSHASAIQRDVAARHEEGDSTAEDPFTPKGAKASSR